MPHLRYVVGKIRLETVGSAEVQNSTVGLVPFTIVKYLGHQAILGSDQLSKGNAKFDFESETLVRNGQNFALYTCADSAPVNNTKLECVNRFNFLGLEINAQLTWKDHVNKISNKIVKTLGIMNKLKYVFPQSALILLCHSLILPHIN